MLLNLTIPGDKFELKLFVQEEQFKPPFQVCVCVLLYPHSISKSQIVLLPKQRFGKVRLGVAHRRTCSVISWKLLFFESDFFIKVENFVFDYNI